MFNTESLRRTVDLDLMPSRTSCTNLHDDDDDKIHSSLLFRSLKHPASTVFYICKLWKHIDLQTSTESHKLDHSLFMIQASSLVFSLITFSLLHAEMKIILLLTNTIVVINHGMTGCIVMPVSNSSLSQVSWRHYHDPIFSEDTS